MPKKLTSSSRTTPPGSTREAGDSPAGKGKLSRPAGHSSGAVIPGKSAEKPRKPAAPGSGAPASGASAGGPAKAPATAAARTRRLKQFCRDLPGTTQDVKWVEHLCFSVGGKMFAIFDVADNGHAAFKADEIEFERLTKKRGIIPAPYAARFSWVKIVERDAMTEKQIQMCLRRSRELIIEKLPAKKRAAVMAMEAGRE